jgi:DNA-directed RNA polymerase specialized sigma24 family protein
VFAIAADDGVQETFVNAYGTYANADSEALLHSLKR